MKYRLTWPAVLLLALPFLLSGRSLFSAGEYLDSDQADRSGGYLDSGQADRSGGGKIGAVKPYLVKPYLEGVFRIKVAESARDSLKISTAPDGVKLLGAATLDQLNRRFGAAEIRRVFRDDPSRGERHRRWGLDRWFELRIKAADRISEAVKAYAADPDVEIAEPIYRKQLYWLPDDPRFPEQWHYRNTGQTGGLPGADIRLMGAWEIERGDPEVIVQVVDSGIDLAHPDLVPNLWVNPDPDPVLNDLHGWNFADGNDNIQDADGHGSHVSGTVAAASNNGLGLAGVAGGSGTGDGVRIMVCRTFGDSGNGGFAEAYVYGADHGAVISQNSWGYTSPGVYEQVVLDGIDYFIANAGDYPGSPLRGGVVIFSAGNSDDPGIWYPGYYPPVIAVAATEHSDRKAWYSNFGDWVDIAAPGGETGSQASQGILSTVIGGYQFYQGTSMAAPHVSGVAGLLASRHPGAEASVLAAVLIGGTDDIDALNPDYVGRLGSGRLNAARSLLTALAVAPGSGFRTAGEAGGPFVPPALTYTLNNISAAPLNWTAGLAEDWVEVSPAGGTLVPGAEVQIEVRLTAAAAALDAGCYTDTLRVVDSSGGGDQLREVLLTANPSLCTALDNCGLDWVTGGAAEWFGQLEESFDGRSAAQSGAIGPSQETWVQTEAAGPGALYFNWRVSSESNYDWLEFSLDAALQERISGETGWREVVCELGEGARALRWVYRKDVSVASGRDRGWLDMVRIDSLLLSPRADFSSVGDEGGPFAPAAQDYTLKNLSALPLEWTAGLTGSWAEVWPAGGTLDPGGETTLELRLTAAAALLPSGSYQDTLQVSNLASGEEFFSAAALRVNVPLCQAVDNCDLAWTTGGDAEWFGQEEESYDGRSAARSGAIGNSRESRLETVVAGPGRLSFWWKVSSEANWDWLEFRVGGELRERLSGEADWREAAFELGTGTHNLAWIYDKDTSTVAGLDCGWLDQVAYAATPLVVEPGEGFFSTGFSGGPFTPSSRIYTLRNTDPESRGWTATASADWLTVSPVGGVLDPGGEIAVEVGLAPGVADLDCGLYAATVEFAPTGGGAALPRSATLVVNAPLLYDNGPVVTHPGGGAGGADASALQTTLDLNVYGFGHHAGIRVADGFTVTDPEGWHIDSVTFPAYQTGSGLDSTITGLYLQIWDGPPGEAGSAVVFGDLATNRLAYTFWSGVYRVSDAALDNTQRPLMADTAIVDRYFPPGTYWVEWMTAGALTSGPWVPPISLLGQTTTGDALQYSSGVWSAILDDGTATGQGLPFRIGGVVGEKPSTPTPAPSPTASVPATPAPTRSPADSPTPGSTPLPPPFLVLAGGDYSGDGVSDIAVFRPGTGLWAVRDLTRIYFGRPGDLPVPGDYSGDGRTEMGIFRPSSGLWAIRSRTRVYFGGGGSLPVPGDYTGDGSCDIAAFEPGTGSWRIRGARTEYFGRPGDLPVPGDYRGEGFERVAIFRPSTGLWAIRGLTRAYFGRPDDRPVPGVYQWYGEKKTAAPFQTQIAVFRPSTGLWAIRGGDRVYFGAAGDYPAVGRFTGFVLDEIGIFRPSSGLWAIRDLTRVYFGTAGDLPATR